MATQQAPTPVAVVTEQAPKAINTQRLTDTNSLQLPLRPPRGNNQVTSFTSGNSIQSMGKSVTTVNTEQKVQNFLNRQHDSTSEAIASSYLQLQELCDNLNKLQDMIGAQNEQAFLVSYKDHMLKVQMELLTMKRKTSDHYMNMKQEQRVRFLEGSVQWMRTEAMNLMKALEKARKANHEMKLELDKTKTEKTYMMEYNRCQKRHNLLLKKTVETLKDPDNMRRYFEASQQRSQGDIIEEELDESPSRNAVTQQPPLHIEINSGNFSPAVTDMEKVILSGNTSTVFDQNHIARISTAQDSHQRQNYQLLGHSKSFLGYQHQRLKSGDISLRQNRGLNRYDLNNEFLNPLNQVTVAQEWMETTDVDKIHTIYQRELKDKERQIDELKTLLYHQQGNYRKVRPATAKSNASKTTRVNFNGIGASQSLNNQPQSSSSVRDLTSKEIAEIFLQCITAVKKQDILEKGTDHWTKTEKNQMIYQFITNKRVLQILYDIMAQGKNEQVSQSHMLSNLSTMRSRDGGSTDDKQSTMLLHHSKSKSLNRQGSFMPPQNQKLRGNLSSLNPLINLSELEDALTDSHINIQHPLRQSLPHDKIKVTNEDSLVKIRTDRAGNGKPIISSKARVASMFGVGSIQHLEDNFEKTIQSEKQNLVEGSRVHHKRAQSSYNRGARSSLKNSIVPQTNLPVVEEGSTTQAIPSTHGKMVQFLEYHANMRQEKKQSALITKSYKIKDGKLLIK